VRWQRGLGAGWEGGLGFSLLFKGLFLGWGEEGLTNYS